MEQTHEHKAIPSLSPRMRRTAEAEGLPEPGRYLAIDDGDDVVLVPLRDGVTRIGRGLTANVRLESQSVSRRHALVITDDVSAILVDDRSRNGTWLNGERIQRAALTDGDVIEIGDTRMRVVLVAGDRLTA